MKRNLAAELTEGMQALAVSRAGKTVHGFKRTLLAVPEVRAEYDALGDEFAIAHEMIAARARAGLS